MGMSILGKTSHNEAPQQNLRWSLLCQCHPGKDSHAPSLHSDSRQMCQGQLQVGTAQGWGTLGLERGQQHSHIHLWEEL